MAGLYTLYKLVRPFHRYQQNYMNYVDLAFDLSLCIVLITLTEGLQSPFMLYCFSPILTSALLFPKKITVYIAALPFLAVAGSQLFIYGDSLAESFSPVGLSLSLLALYLVASFLLAWLPYVMNINVFQNVKADAILEERNRLSRDIHDGLAQTLSIIRWKLDLLGKTMLTKNVMQSIDELNEITDMMEGAQQEAKTVIDKIHTSIQGKEGLAPTLARYTGDFTRQYGIRCELHVADGVVKLSSLAQLQLLCVAQEALANVRKHAKASTVRVSLESKDDITEMRIRDDGQGFNINRASGGHGLRVMKERIKTIGGEFGINTGVGAGTEVNVKVERSE